MNTRTMGMAKPSAKEACRVVLTGLLGSAGKGLEVHLLDDEGAGNGAHEDEAGYVQGLDAVADTGAEQVGYGDGNGGEGGLDDVNLAGQDQEQADQDVRGPCLEQGHVGRGLGELRFPGAHPVLGPVFAIVEVPSVLGGQEVVLGSGDNNGQANEARRSGTGIQVRGTWQPSSREQ